MKKIEGTCKEVLEKTEWLAIATTGEAGLSLVGTWGEYVNTLGRGETTLYIPVAGYFKTEANLATGSEIEILCATQQVIGHHGPGQGYRIHGNGRIETEGDHASRVKNLYPWARGVLIVEALNIVELL